MTQTPTLNPRSPRDEPPRPQSQPDRGAHFARHAQPARGPENLGFFGRLRDAIASLLALTIGITAFGYALKQVHHLVFVTSASAAKVAGPVYTVSMPREGTFH